MGRLNTKAVNTNRTFEGAQAAPTQKSEVRLERAVATALLWEPTFYERGNELSQRITSLSKEVSPEYLSQLAVRARTEWKLRHAPLYLTVQLIKAGRNRRDQLVANTIAQVVNRPDEITELIAMYWKENGGRKMLPNQVKLGLSRAFNKFDEYQLGKWNRDSEIKLRDALFLAHAKPENPDKEALFKKLVDGTLATPDTWEVALSGGQDKKAAFTRLLETKKLPYMAMLQNMRNMDQAGVERDLIKNALVGGAKNSKALPFRFVAAAKVTPGLADVINDAMLMSIDGMYNFRGDTVILIDVSGSMDYKLSQKSDNTRIDAASAVAVLAREAVKDRVNVYTFSQKTVPVNNWRGLPLIDGIAKSQAHSGTYLKASLEQIKNLHPNLHRLVVITDEQSQDGIIDGWAKYNYIINVANYDNVLDTKGTWQRIHGFSERLFDWFQYAENVSDTVEVAV